MKLIKLEIKGLFDLFDYEIPLSNPENLTIITGPNGFGKTMILNIIDSLFNKKFLFFQNLIFNEIHFLFDEQTEIIILKKGNISKQHLEINIIEKKEIVDNILVRSDKIKEGYEGLIARYFPAIRKLDAEHWQDRRNRRIFSRLEIFELFNKTFPDEIHNKVFFDYQSRKFDGIIKKIDVHMIKEQRLLKRRFENENNTTEYAAYIDDSIQEFANELSTLIKFTINESSKISQELDSNFPNRLLNEKGQLTETDFKMRFAQLKDKKEKLRKFGLSESFQEVPESFILENAKVLLVYLNDSEKKSSVFDDLLERLELFTNILNGRRFTYKSIKIDKEQGFSFVTSKNKPLDLTDLSSGEQHEVILLYELIFKAKSNTLVLIDEPEISLHVTWQKEFLNDLMKIIDLQKIQVIIATHSPQIINNRWDLTVDLEKSEE